MVESKEVLTVLDKIGDFVSSITEKILSFIQDMGLITSPATAKIITILIVALIAYLILHFVSSLKTPVRVIIYILTGLLIISVLISFFPLPS
ncbi:MAG: hypothetical protein AABY22_35785 [Nanoarchaeota archaeon]